MPLIYGKGKQKTFRRLQEKINKYSKISQPDAPVEKPHNAHWIVPFERNPRFIGRESQLAQLERKLLTGESTTKIAVTGLGGVKKPQLVLELLYRTRQTHENSPLHDLRGRNRRVFK
jgi:hypothetical protein